MRSNRNYKTLLLAIILSALMFACDDKTNADNVTNANTSEAYSNKNSVVSEGDEYCIKVYDELLDKYKQDYVSCLSDASVELRKCPKPDGFDDAFKENLNIVIALDASGSMNGEVAGGQKMEIAKKAINDFVGTLPERANVGLIVYGHKGSNKAEQKQQSCAGVEPIYAVGKINKPEFKRVVDSFNPTGWTPLASAIDKSGEILKGQIAENSTNLVYIVSDGIETCGGNPVESAKNLNQTNIKAVVNIIGFDVDDESQTQLKQAASAGGGQYFDAKNAADLNRIFGGVSKSVAQYNEYLRCMTANKQDVKRVFTNKEQQIFLCVSNKSREESDLIRKERTDWSRAKDPRDRCASYIIETQNAREQRIKVWRDELTEKLKTEKNTTYEQLERELKEVTDKRTIE